ncbi:MAG: YtxH domain-containing protein [Elusimicrobiota bacterium]|nr:YtxH domain-containing protein [Elusimicrobiota bacterium]
MAEKNSGETILAFLLGGIIGACLGILFAPNSGKETRRKLKVLLEDLGEKAEDWIEEGKEKVEDVVSDVKERVFKKEPPKGRSREE